MRTIHYKSRLKVMKGKLNLAPLVDVAFLLIIFFVLATSYDLQSGFHAEAGQGIQSPKVKGAPLVAGDKLLIVLNHLEGQKECGLYFNNQSFSWKDFDYTFSDAVHARTSGTGKEKRRPVISLKVDGRVPYHYVMRVLALAYKLELEVNQLVDEE